jgi:hypothetical protein
VALRGTIVVVEGIIASLVYSRAKLAFLCPLRTIVLNGRSCDQSLTRNVRYHSSTYLLFSDTRYDGVNILFHNSQWLIVSITSVEYPLLPPIARDGYQRI